MAERHVTRITTAEDAAAYLGRFAAPAEPKPPARCPPPVMPRFPKRLVFSVKFPLARMVLDELVKIIVRPGIEEIRLRRTSKGWSAARRCDTFFELPKFHGEGETPTAALVALAQAIREDVLAGGDG